MLENNLEVCEKNSSRFNQTTHIPVKSQMVDP